jgi:hypothetical protein
LCNPISSKKHFSGLTSNIDDLNELAKNCKAAQLKFNLENSFNNEMKQLNYL